MRHLSSLSAAIVGAGLTMGLMVPQAQAIDLFSIWAQGHGSVVAGGGPYFDNVGMPAAGYGAELGIQILVLQAYIDFSLMDQQEVVDDTMGYAHWNHLGFGPRIRVPLPTDDFDLYALANANFLNADYVVDQVTIQNQAWQFRAGAGAEFRLGAIFWVGADAQVGYHLFEESPGLDLQARAFFKLRTTVHSGGDDDNEPGLLDPMTR